MHDIACQLCLVGTTVYFGYDVSRIFFYIDQLVRKLIVVLHQFGMGVHRGAGRYVIVVDLVLISFFTNTSYNEVMVAKFQGVNFAGRHDH